MKKTILKKAIISLTAISLITPSTCFAGRTGDTRDTNYSKTNQQSKKPRKNVAPNSQHFKQPIEEILPMLMNVSAARTISQARDGLTAVYYDIKRMTEHRAFQGKDALAGKIRATISSLVRPIVRPAVATRAQNLNAISAEGIDNITLQFIRFKNLINTVIGERRISRERENEIYNKLTALYEQNIPQTTRILRFNLNA